MYRSIAEETVGELEKEKTMKELEMRDALNAHRSEIGARDALVQGLRDRTHEMCATVDLQRKVRSLHSMVIEDIYYQLMAYR